MLTFLFFGKIGGAGERGNNNILRLWNFGGRNMKISCRGHSEIERGKMMRKGGGGGHFWLAQWGLSGSFLVGAIWIGMSVSFSKSLGRNL